MVLHAKALVRPLCTIERLTDDEWTTEGRTEMASVAGRCLLQVTGHRSQVIVLPIQKLSQTLVKANLRPN